MGRNVKALKDLYKALGGNASTVASVKTTASMISAIATLIGTTGGLLPSVDAEDNNKVLTVVSGEWDAKLPE